MKEERELDISYIMSTIGRWFLLILLFAIIGGTSAIFYNYGAPIKYQSNTTLYVEPGVSANAVDYQGILTNQRMVKTYAAIIKSRSVVNKVIKQAELEMTYKEFISNLTVNVSTDTQMITIYFKDIDKNVARDVTNLVASTFIAEIEEKLNVTNISVVDEAIISKNPVEPRTTLNITIGIVGGLAVGLMLAFLFQSMDNKIKTHEDVKKYLKIKTLGVIPHNSIDYEVNGKKKKYVKPVNGTNIKMITDPTSIVSESVRIIRTNLNFSDLKLINVTSTVPSEGKSEVITNLAVSFAMLDKKVLIVDCDLRKPKIHRNFGLIRNQGVSDVVLSRGTLDYRQVVQQYTANKVTIDVLTAGSKISNPSELINSVHFSNLIKKLKEDYDLVLIDCPPISNMTDGVLVSKLSDGTVYVIESDKTDYQVISDCIDELRNNNVFILGAILTKVDIKKEKKLYGYKYDYYYSNYNK